MGYRNLLNAEARPARLVLAKDACMKFSGKTLYCFARKREVIWESVEDITKFCSQSTILDGLEVRGRDVKKSAE